MKRICKYETGNSQKSAVPPIDIETCISSYSSSIVVLEVDSYTLSSSSINRSSSSSIVVLEVEQLCATQTRSS